MACQSSEAPKNPDSSSTTPSEENLLPEPKPIPVKNLPQFDQDFLMGKFNPAKHPDFVEVDIKHASRKGMYLHQDTYESFKKMWEAAKKDGVNLKVISATRNFDRQKRIWEAKWNGSRKVGGKDLSKTIPDANERAYKILEYSSMPGTSRHHWGSDLDINALENDYFDRGVGKKIYNWMTANAAKYGFCQTYTPKGPLRPYGYNEERWHWSYLPLAKQLSNQFRLKVKNEDISGFDGAETAKGIDVVEKYVFGINKDCL